jgi:hypothetical protein
MYQARHLETIVASDKEKDVDVSCGL